MNVIQTELPEVVLIEPDVFGDSRGFFCETFSVKRYVQAGITAAFVQDNVSFSQKKVIRGLHYQHPNAQGKLVQVLSGTVYDVAVDIRRGSPFFGKWIGAKLSCRNHRQLYIPPGFAHGFCVLSQTAFFCYKCTEFYDPNCEGGIIWNDPDINIQWPIERPELSKKDAAYGLLKDIPIEKLPCYGEVK